MEEINVNDKNPVEAGEEAVGDTLNKSDNRKTVGEVQRVPEYHEFIKHCATPRPFRELKTQAAFAEKFGVSEDSLTDWKKRPDFQKEVRAEIRRQEKDDEPEIRSVLRHKAMDGDLRAIDIYLKHRFPEDDNELLC